MTDPRFTFDPFFARYLAWIFDAQTQTLYIFAVLLFGFPVLNEIKRLAKEVYGTKFEGGIGEQPGAGKRRGRKKKPVIVGTGDGVDWNATVDQLMERQNALDQNAPW